MPAAFKREPLISEARSILQPQHACCSVLLLTGMFQPVTVGLPVSAYGSSPSASQDSSTPGFHAAEIFRNEEGSVCVRLDSLDLKRFLGENKINHTQLSISCLTYAREYISSTGTPKPGILLLYVLPRP